MKAPAIVLCVALVAAEHSFAVDEEPVRKGFFWGGGLGGAYLERTFSSTNWTDDAAGRFYMEFFGGYAFNPHVSVGLEMGGWLITPSDNNYSWNPYWPPDNERSEDPAGEGLSQILVFTRLYPYEDKGLFIKLGGGYMDHWWETSSRNYSEDGWTSVAGVGWDIHASGNWSITPTVSYSYGEAGHQTHQAITASLGFMWHQWKGPVRHMNLHVSDLERAWYPNEPKTVLGKASKFLLFGKL
jgi:hypothetical protein